jgi:hypothetical protein
LVFFAFTVLSSNFLALLLSVEGVVAPIAISLIYLKLRVIIFK